MNMKNEIKPLAANIIIKPYIENPYVKAETENGFILNDGNFKNQDTGEEDTLDKLIGCGEVIEVGPNCTHVKIGDDVFFDNRSIRPLPFKRLGFVVISENGIIALMGDDLTERF